MLEIWLAISSAVVYQTENLATEFYQEATMTEFCGGIIQQYGDKVQDLLTELLIWKLLCILAFALGFVSGRSSR